MEGVTPRLFPRLTEVVEKVVASRCLASCFWSSDAAMIRRGVNQFEPQKVKGACSVPFCHTTDEALSP